MKELLNKCRKKGYTLHLTYIPGNGITISILKNNETLYSINSCIYSYYAAIKKIKEEININAILGAKNANENTENNCR